MDRMDLPFGWIGPYGDNEVEIVSTKQDPPKLRLAVDSENVESNLGAVSMNLRRSDGVHEEMAYVQGRLTADRKAGALYLATRGPHDQQPIERFYLDHTIAIFHVPIIGGSGGGQQLIQSPDGRLQLIAQGDYNLVLYKDGKPIKALFGLPPEMLW